jgi:hypothetical protein
VVILNEPSSYSRFVGKNLFVEAFKKEAAIVFKNTRLKNQDIGNLGR